MDLPDELYHATFAAYLSGIERLGLVPNPPNVNWEGLSRSCVYLIDDADLAVAFCEAADCVGDDVYDSGIVLFKVQTAKLNPYSLYKDENVRDEYCQGSFEYIEAIPYSDLERVV